MKQQKIFKWSVSDSKWPPVEEEVSRPRRKLPQAKMRLHNSNSIHSQTLTRPLRIMRGRWLCQVICVRKNSDVVNEENVELDGISITGIQPNFWTPRASQFMDPICPTSWTPICPRLPIQPYPIVWGAAEVPTRGQIGVHPMGILHLRLRQEQHLTRPPEAGDLICLDFPQSTLVQGKTTLIFIIGN